MVNQKRRRFVLIIVVTLTLLVIGAIACWMNRELIWPKTTDDYVFTDHMTQANNYLSEGNSDGVTAELNEALRIKPDSGDARLKLAAFLDYHGKYSDSINCYRTGLKYQPDSLVFLDNLAWLLVSCRDASLRNGPQAVQLAEKSCRLTNYRIPAYVTTLGTAYAEAGRFSDAITMAKKARELATATNIYPAWLGEENQELEALYREHKTYGQVVDSQFPAGESAAPYVKLYYYTQHEKFMHEPNKEKVNLLFLGDSITEYWRKQGSNVWNSYYAPRHAASFGIGGETTAGVLWQIKQGELANLKPKVIVLLIGTNQTGTDSPDKIASDIEAVVKKIRATCPDSKVLLLGLFPRNKSGDTPAQIESIAKVNAIIANMDDGKMIYFLNIGNRFLKPDGKISAVLMPDFLHPSEKGYQVFAEAMEPTLAEMLK